MRCDKGISVLCREDCRFYTRVGCVLDVDREMDIEEIAEVLEEDIDRVRADLISAILKLRAVFENE